MKINLSEFSPVISSKEDGEEIFNRLKKALDSDDLIEIDFDKIKTMATFCAKQIFGSLYIKLGADVFFRRIHFINVSDDVKVIIQSGIQNAIEEINKAN